MVSLRAATVPRAIVVKRRRASSPLTRVPVCIWPGCDAVLARDHPQPVCSCHAHGQRVYHHRSDRLVLHLLIAAYPAAIDLCGVLRCTSHELEATLKRLRRKGHTISGVRRGYVYEVSDSQWR